MTQSFAPVKPFDDHVYDSFITVYENNSHFTTLRAKRAMFISKSVPTTLVRHFWSFSNTVYYDSIVMDHLMSKMIVIHAEKKLGQQELLYRPD